MCAIAIDGDILCLAGAAFIINTFFCCAFYFQAGIAFAKVGGVAALMVFICKAFAAGIAAFVGASALYLNCRTAAAVIFIACTSSYIAF